MTQTYDPTSTTDTNRVRRFIGDTNAASQGYQLHNEEIADYVSLAGNLAYGAALCCEQIAGQMALRVKSKTVGDESLTFNDPEFWHKQAARCRAGGPGDLPGGDGSGVPTAVVYGGGQSVADRNTLAQDTDRIMGPAAQGRDDIPGTPTSVLWSPWSWVRGW